jgi:nucleoside phosphorylase
MPPGFLAEDKLVREVLDLKGAFRDERLILLPIRESLDEYWTKKEREYASVRTHYSGLFSREGHRFVEQNAHLLIDRPFVVGPALLSEWEDAPDSSRYWNAKFRSHAPSVVELFRKAPRYLAEGGEAITWETISMRIPEVAQRHPEYRKLVQNIYLGLYINNLDLRILTSLPYARDDFGLGSGDLFYDYNAIRALIEPSGLWESLLELTPWEMIELRKTPGYFAFRRSARQLVDRCPTYYDVKRCMALPESDLAKVCASTLEAQSPWRGQLLLPFENVNVTRIEAFGERIARVTQLALERSANEDRRRVRLQSLFDSMMSAKKEPAVMASGGATNILIGLFAALPEEREVLARELAFTPVPGDTSVLRGVLPDGTKVLLYGGNLMGRVPAAVETSYVLSRNSNLSAIVVVGLAGGFAEQDVRQGHLLVPYQIVDLASRKIVSRGDARTDTSVRPQGWELDRRLGEYLDTQITEEWNAEACDKYDWPKDRRPMLRIGGSMVCLDEVVADDAYRGKLQEAWGGQLLGVEMESVGVMAGARRFRGLGFPIFQIRAVADTADPAKSDDSWRKLGMQTISSILRRITWDKLLAPS